MPETNPSTINQTYQPSTINHQPKAMTHQPSTIIHFIETKTEEQPLAACHWVEHFYEQGRRVQILAGSALAAQRLDHLLWTFAQASFIPHRICPVNPAPPAVEPVIITMGELTVEGASVLICDGPAGLEFVQHYDEVVHFVLLDDSEKRLESRSLWQAVREKGIQANHISYAPKGRPFSQGPK
jgi:DNA polymerase-3 subunit chi